MTAYYRGFPALSDEPWYDFESLDELVGFLKEIGQHNDLDGMDEYADQVKRGGDHGAGRRPPAGRWPQGGGCEGADGTKKGRPQDRPRSPVDPSVTISRLIPIRTIVASSCWRSMAIRRRAAGMSVCSARLLVDRVGRPAARGPS